MAICQFNFKNFNINKNKTGVALSCMENTLCNNNAVNVNVNVLV